MAAHGFARPGGGGARLPGEEVAYRQATARDAGILRDLSGAFYNEHIERWGADSLQPWPFQQIKAALGNRDVAIFLAEVAGKPVGFSNGIILKPDSPSPIGRIESIFVLPGQRGAGVAEELMRLLLDGLGARGAAVWELVVASENKQALAFFARFGFRDGDLVMGLENTER